MQVSLQTEDSDGEGSTTGPAGPSRSSLKIVDIEVDITIIIIEYIFHLSSDFPVLNFRAIRHP